MILRAGHLFTAGGRRGGYSPISRYIRPRSTDTNQSTHRPRLSYSIVNDRALVSLFFPLGPIERPHHPGPGRGRPAGSLTPEPAANRRRRFTGVVSISSASKPANHHVLGRTRRRRCGPARHRQEPGLNSLQVTGNHFWSPVPPVEP